jgi:hypothetical protein
MLSMSTADSQKVLSEKASAICTVVVELYSKEFLRSPNDHDILKMDAMNAKRGFPGMIGSLDCTHIKWKNCTRAWSGQFTCKEGKPTVVMEAVASVDLLIWHAVFGLPGSLNDINILQRSDLLDKILKKCMPRFDFNVNGTHYTQPYF